MQTIQVQLKDRTYPVLIGSESSKRLESVIPKGAKRAAIVTQPEIGIACNPGIESRTFFIGQGEAAKSMATVEMLANQFSAWGLTRGDVIIGLGGGLVTDVAGFAAATYHRGIDVVHMSTTLLGQVDAAIGGKTGVNLSQGKNLVGAYWQPHAVICDTDHLKSLPKREYLSGLGEVAKYHFLGGGALDGLELEERVARCVEIKADVVAADERESGQRAILNYGHTLAHALEIEGGFDLRHGEAVAIGLVYAARVAKALGRIGEDDVQEHIRVLETYGLQWRLPPKLDFDTILTLMGRDKKAITGLTMALDGSEGVEVVKNLNADLLLEVLHNSSALDKA